MGSQKNEAARLPEKEQCEKLPAELAEAVVKEITEKAEGGITKEKAEQAGEKRKRDALKMDVNVPDRIITREERIALARRLTLMSDVFMSTALNDILACQYVVRTILERPDLVVKSVRTQYEISKIVSHGARLDVLAADSENQLYNIEIQVKDDVNHAKRIRFYGAMVDSEFLEKGGAYEDMPELHVIYITETDIWHGGKTIYHVKKVLDGTDVPYEDGIYIHYVNAAVNDGSAIAKLMEYFKTADPADDSQGDLSKRVRMLKAEEGSDKAMCEAADMLMKLGERIGEARGRAEGEARGRAEGEARGRAEGEAHGRSEGEARVNALLRKLVEAKRYEDLERSARDMEYQKVLYQEFGL